MERPRPQLPARAANVLSTQPIGAPNHGAPVAPLLSPCVSACRIDPASDLCTGCGRTLDEIAAWSTGTPEWRAAVMLALPGRLSIPPR